MQLVIGFIFLNLTFRTSRRSREDEFFRVLFRSITAGNVLHKGVDIEMGLKHREDEFSFVKLAPLQERTTQGCRSTKKNAMGEARNKLR